MKENADINLKFSVATEDWTQWRVGCYSDASWVGDGENRKSTSGGTVPIGGQWIKSWSKGHAATAKIIAEGLGVKSMWADWSESRDRRSG